MLSWIFWQIWATDVAYVSRFANVLSFFVTPILYMNYELSANNDSLRHYICLLKIASSFIWDRILDTQIYAYDSSATFCFDSVHRTVRGRKTLFYHSLRVNWRRKSPHFLHFLRDPFCSYGWTTCAVVFSWSRPELSQSVVTADKRLSRLAIRNIRLRSLALANLLLYMYYAEYSYFRLIKRY